MLKKAYIGAVLLAWFTVRAQLLPVLTLPVGKVYSEVLVDDFNGLYLNDQQGFTLEKHSASGEVLASRMLDGPYHIQDVLHPLNIALFSENSQKILFLDQFLNQKQEISLRDFGYIRAAFVENQETVWLLNESTRQLLKYGLRSGTVEKSLLISFPEATVKDMVVSHGVLYLLTAEALHIVEPGSGRNLAVAVTRPVRLRRDSGELLVFTTERVFRLSGENTLVPVFYGNQADLVEKNSQSYFVISAGKLYLYAPK